MVCFSFFNEDDMFVPGIRDACLSLYELVPNSNFANEKQYSWILQCFYERTDRLRSVMIHKTDEYILVETLLVWLDASKKEQKKLLRVKMDNETTMGYIYKVLSGNCDVEITKMELESLKTKFGGWNGIYWTIRAS